MPPRKKAAGVEIKRATELSLELTDEHLTAIRKCLDNGRLTIKFTDIDLLTSGRLGDPYLYD
ncbi:MAG TPA: hypothetical protein VFB78_03855 [Acidimicrobiales bacterium]|jgi:hypothetical protein|nr:hypothetical protein [Acidimicrobiales bacterium]